MNIQKDQAILKEEKFRSISDENNFDLEMNPSTPAEDEV